MRDSLPHCGGHGFLFTLLPVVAALKMRIIKRKRVNIGGNMTRIKTSYCQGCIRTEVTLKLTRHDGKAYWLCERCLNPLPKEAYTKATESDSRKAWGDSKYENKG